MPEHAPLSASIELEIPFHDVDAMEVAWHGHYAKYFELARCELLDQYDFNYPQMQAAGHLWPVINLNIRYVKPAVFKQRIRVTATLIEWENRLRIQYAICDARTGDRLTKGYTDMVAVDRHSGEMLLASPPILYQKFGLDRV